MSLWEKYQSEKRFDKLDKDIEIDTLIIGGGIVGLTTFYYLKDQEGICLVDASRIGEGITKNTTGKLTYLQGAIYTDLEKNRNKEVAVQYLNSQNYAISLIKEIIEKEKINCNLEKVDSYSFTNKEKELETLKKEKNFLEQQNIEVKEEALPFAVPYLKSINVKDTYVFNPIKYLNGLKEVLKEKKIYEQTKIIKIEYKNQQYICYTDSRKIIAKKVIVACHYPFFIYPVLLPLKSHIEKSYLMAIKDKEYKNASCINIENPSISIRYYKDLEQSYQIFLTRSHNTAIKQNDLENFEDVKRTFGLKKEDIVAKWSNVDIITDDKLPYIGKVKDELFLATGFNTWGMTNGILAAKILSDAIKEKQNPYQELFKIHRKNIYQCKSFFPNITTSMIAMVKSKWLKKKWYKKNLTFKKVNGKTIAIYKDEQEKEHIVYTTCPHFGCSLVFNETEKTWDCPCHSSRFDLDGKCIKGPSLYDISYKK